jgi:FtsP/CotA-like multicopper oxidase with cupredoxin domain
MPAVKRGHRIGLILVAVAVAVIGVLLIGQSDTDDDAEPVVTTPAPGARDKDPTATVRVPEPPDRVEIIRIVDGKPKGGVRKLEFEKGDTVRIEVRSNRPAEVHVHGYDISNDVAAGGRIRFAFDAKNEGVYEIEVEETHTPLAELVVEP